jgi:hypothetical protein
VRVYSNAEVFDGTVEMLPKRGDQAKVFVFHGEASVLNGWYWPQQLRRLKKRERLWLIARLDLNGCLPRQLPAGQFVAVVSETQPATMFLPEFVRVKS